jgi:hypothetical protein
MRPQIASFRKGIRLFLCTETVAVCCGNYRKHNALCGLNGKNLIVETSNSYLLLVINLLVYLFINLLVYSYYGTKAPAGQPFPLSKIHYHSDTTHSVGLLWTSDQTEAVTSA